MKRMKTFLIYFLLVVAFFIFSQIIIYFSIRNTYVHKSVEIKSTYIKEAEVEATNVNGFAKVVVKNYDENVLENKYIKVSCYSKNNVLMGTEYMKIDTIKAKEEKEYEVRFKFNKVENAVIDLVEEQATTDN